MDDFSSKLDRLSSKLKIGLTGVWELEVKDNVMSMHFDDSLLDFLGYTRENFPTDWKNFRDNCCHPDDAAGLEKELVSCICGEIEILRQEYRIWCRHTKSWHWTFVFASVDQRDEDLSYIRISGITQDIQNLNNYRHFVKQAAPEEQAAGGRTAELEQQLREQAQLLLGVKRRAENILNYLDLQNRTFGLKDAPLQPILNQSPQTDEFLQALNNAFDAIADKMWWYKAILDSLPFPIAVADLQKRYTYLNRPALELKKASGQAELIGSLCQPWNRAAELDLIKMKSLAKDQEAAAPRTFYLEIPEIKQHFQGQSSYLFDRRDNCAGYIEAMQDITGMRRTESELRRSKEVAEEHSRAKSDFLANMSHEIRTPMNAILGMTRLVLNTPLNEAQRDYLEKAELSAKSLLRIINDILDFSKIEAGKLEVENIPFDLEKVLGQLMHMLRPAAEKKGLHLELELSPKIPAGLTGDPLRLNQVLTNLAGNAIKFTRHGHVKISVHMIDQRPEDIVLLFAVQDTGIGIAPEAFKNLFSAFSQADTSTTRKYGGTGLGLVISKTLIAMMGGEIWCNSRLGQGSDFYFTASFGVDSGLAARREIINEAPERERPEDQVALFRGARILVAEDNEINQFIVKEMLERAGFLVDIAANGRQAVTMARLKKYQLIFMDIQMPEMDGFCATRKIRALPELAGVPIVAMTAHALVGDREKSLAAGMNEHLTKPIDQDAVFTVMADLLNRAAEKS